LYRPTNPLLCTSKRCKKPRSPSCTVRESKVSLTKSESLETGNTKRSPNSGLFPKPRQDIKSEDNQLVSNSQVLELQASSSLSKPGIEIRKFLQLHAAFLKQKSTMRCHAMPCASRHESLVPSRDRPPPIQVACRSLSSLTPAMAMGHGNGM
jgi:hypothetical protein